ncbi:MAG: hypothetical protein HY305_07335, partial [Sphingobacteriales bacterium]|nr:hypothetical protein [Sphingobacteriales bacterium]
SCIGPRPAYYFSPFNTTSQYYHAIPLTSDSIKSATYANVVLTNGVANYRGSDKLYGIQASMHRSHNGKFLQGYYGAGVSIGRYEVKEYKGPYNIDSATPVIEIPGSNKNFGSYGLNGGVNIVWSFGNGGEWRIIGVEASLQNELGSYLQFRKLLPSESIGVVETRNITNTVGVFTECIWKRRNKVELGYKMALGGSFLSKKYYLGYSSKEPVYFSNTLHITRANITGFTQINIGTSAYNFQTGINVRIGRKKR